jgi:hypothetical protein
MPSACASRFHPAAVARAVQGGARRQADDVVGQRPRQRARRHQGLLRYDGAAAGGINLARFDLPQMNEAIARLQALPDGAERDAVFDARQAADRGLDAVQAAHAPGRPRWCSRGWSAFAGRCSGTTGSTSSTSSRTPTTPCAAAERRAPAAPPSP